MSGASVLRAMTLGVALLATAAVAVAQDAWHTMTGPDQSFTVELPAAPKYTPTQLSGPASTTYTMHQYQLEKGEAAFIVQYIVYPAGIDVSNPQHNLQSGLNASGKTMEGGKWGSIKFVKHGTLPAADAVGIADGNDVRSYSVVKGRQLATLIYVGPKGSARSPDVERFIASLKLGA